MKAEGRRRAACEQLEFGVNLVGPVDMACAANAVGGSRFAAQLLVNSKRALLAVYRRKQFGPTI